MQHTARPTPTCRKCNAAMVHNGITPCAEGYDMWSYRCLTCRDAFDMVEMRTPFSAAISERRILLRYPVATAGTIQFNAGTICCMVRNLSAAGAELGLTRHTEPPGRITLIADGSHLPGRVIWRREKRIGIAFL
jgi:hypothetical protein